MPEGTWQYTDTPTYAANWVGVESAESGPVTVNTTPTVSVTYPVDGTTYGADWTAMITGTASSNSGLRRPSHDNGGLRGHHHRPVRGTARRSASSSQTFVPVTGTTTWLLGLVADNLTSGDNYSVVAQATDSAGNVGTSSTVTLYLLRQHHHGSPDGHHHLPG